jgi:hypothetical protein
MSALEGILQATSKLETFVEKPTACGDQCREALTAVYRLANEQLKASTGASKRNGGAFVAPPQLITANFHVEQIWSQIDVMTDAIMKRVRYAVSLMMLRNHAGGCLSRRGARQPSKPR